MDYTKYTIKRLRQIVKFHNKNVRSYVKKLKQDELKKHIIKVGDYKTKELLVKRMKESSTYHSEYITLDKSSDKQTDFNELLEEYYKLYLNTAKSGDTEGTKKQLNASMGYIQLILDSDLNLKNNITIAERKTEFRKRAKADMKQGKKDDKLDAEVEADYDKATTKPQKVKTPKQPKYNKIVKKIAESKPAEQKKQVKELVKVSKKVNDKTSKVIGKSIMGQFAIDLNKSSNPEKVLEQLIKQYQEKNMPEKGTHKMPDGTIMSGKTHSKDSKPVKKAPAKKAPAKKALPKFDELVKVVLKSYDWLNKYDTDNIQPRLANKNVKQMEAELQKMVKEFQIAQQKQFEELKPMNDYLKSKEYNELPNDTKNKMARKLVKIKKKYESDLKGTFDDINKLAKEMAKKASK